MEFINKLDIPTPCYVIDEEKLVDNAKKLAEVHKRTGATVLLALKAFSMYSVFPLIRDYLAGITASSLNEARLGYEEFREQVHVYSPGIQEHEFAELMKYSDHFVFNSFSQWLKFKDQLSASSKKIECGLRLNPEYAEIKTDLYNPCIKNSRLGITLKEFKPEFMDGISGFHFHALCEQSAEVLERVLAHFEAKFAPYLNKVKWVNFGGGHHITKPDYNLDLLCNLITNFKNRYQLEEIIIEPGEALALNAGYLVTEVVDLVHNDFDIAILNTSAACHMPDVLEMPYKPEILGAAEPNILAHTYRLGGVSCLAKDIVGDYSFEEPLKIGQKLIFTDMAHYTMVKTTFFNGVQLPHTGLITKDKKFKLIKSFSYEDFKSKL
jgi:carboxynorspermidine decarboxylase